MCRLASFVFKAVKSCPVKVWDISGHSETLSHFKLDDGTAPGGWREGHYLPDGTLECRVLDVDRITAAEAEASVRERWPDFMSFLNWALTQPLPDNLNLSGLKSADSLKLPDTVGGYLDLRGLKSAVGLKLPDTVGGYLYLGRRIKDRQLIDQEKYRVVFL